MEGNISIMSPATVFKQQVIDRHGILINKDKEKMTTSQPLNSRRTFKESESSREEIREQPAGLPDEDDTEKDRVFYMFLHDMKNPLTTSRGFLSRLLSHKAGALTEKQKEYLEIVHNNHEEIESLLTQFFDILRTRSRHLSPEFSTFDIVALIAKIIDTAHIKAGEKGILLSLEYSNPTYAVSADMVMVTRIVRNLLDNALAHTQSGGTITVTVSEQDDDVLVQIIDTGNGIPHFSIPYVFDPFYQVRKNGNGSGLGLYIVKQFIELHGGKIWMESIHGKGTSFSFTLPKRNALTTTENYKE